jgi:hypothetical protein
MYTSINRWRARMSMLVYEMLIPTMFSYYSLSSGTSCTLKNTFWFWQGIVLNETCALIVSLTGMFLSRHWFDWWENSQERNWICSNVKCSISNVMADSLTTTRSHRLPRIFHDLQSRNWLKVSEWDRIVNILFFFQITPFPRMWWVACRWEMIDCALFLENDVPISWMRSKPFFQSNKIVVYVTIKVWLETVKTPV